MLAMLRYAPWVLAMALVAGAYWLGGVSARQEVDRLEAQIESMERMNEAERNLRGATDDGVLDWLRGRGK